jgi:hypothetical protein
MPSANRALKNIIVVFFISVFLLCMLTKFEPALGQIRRQVTGVVSLRERGFSRIRG